MSRIVGIFAGWKGLGRFWLVIGAVAWVAAAVLALLGPKPHETALQPAPVSEIAKPPASAEARPANTPAPALNADLQEAAPGLAHAVLPRIGADGRTPMRAYAATFDSRNLRPRVGILLAGIGMSEPDSMAAIKALPAGVSLAITPYAANVDGILDAARKARDEYVLSVPMEPQGYPLNDPDDQHALMTSLSPADNLARLYWVMSRITGYVGVTNAVGQLHGERLSGQADQLESVLSDVGRRGLLFVDARPGTPRLPLAWNRSVSIVIDAEPADAAAIDARLDSLSRMALDQGSALGLVSLPRPKAIERVAAWTTGLTAKGLVLAPVSALVAPPAAQEGPDK